VDLLDLGLLVALVIFAVAGFRQGFIVGVLGFAGFVGGGAIGMVLVPLFIGHGPVAVGEAGIALSAVLVCAGIGQLLCSWLGNVLRSRVAWQPARRVDAAAGALLSACAMLLVAWFLALAVVQGPFPALTRQVRGSRVLAGVDAVMPDSARQLFSDFRSAIDGTVFPQVFGNLAPAHVLSVSAPDAALLRDPGITRAKASIVEVSGVASSCHEQITGTGFVVAPGRVVTNAHVVAGVGQPQVQVGGVGLGRRATVVYFDPKVDLAVLEVPGLRAPLLHLATQTVARGTSAVVAGFPGGGAYTAVPARVREAQQARGRDIYDQSSVTRQVYALRAVVRPGNSGGPLLLTNGSVAGVVFAAAVDDPDTGYALTSAEIASDVRAGVAATGSVSTGRCS
jgi:S1-C subfamily serine protease